MNVYPRIYSLLLFLYCYYRYFSLGDGIIGKTAVVNAAHPGGERGSPLGSKLINGSYRVMHKGDIINREFLGGISSDTDDHTVISRSHSNADAGFTSGNTVNKESYNGNFTGESTVTNERYSHYNDNITSDGGTTESNGIFSGGTASVNVGSTMIGGNHTDFGDGKRVVGGNTLIYGSYNDRSSKDATVKMYLGSNRTALNVSHLGAGFQYITDASLDNGDFFSNSGAVVSNNYSLNNGSDSTDSVNSNRNSLFSDKYHGIGSIINNISEGKFWLRYFSDTLGEPYR